MADFGGYVVKTSCDGKGVAYRYGDEKLFIVRDAFRHSINKEVPVVWVTCDNHDSNIIGYATLEQNRDGVYARVSIRDNNPKTKDIRRLIQDGTIRSLVAIANDVDIIGNKLIYANIEKISVTLNYFDGSEPFIVRESSHNAVVIFSLAKIDAETAV